MKENGEGISISGCFVAGLWF